MQSDVEYTGALGHIRVLDLADDKGYLCGKVLADLGADVIKIEPPGGDPGRKNGPFYHDMLDPEKSLYWFAYNVGKKGITLEIETSEGRSIFNRLVKTADVVIESFSPADSIKKGLYYAELGKVNPSIVAVSITPFGMTGPYKDYKAYDLVATAMGGALYLTGDADRPPLFINGSPQAYLQASLQAAVATTIALWHRELSGEGQQVDVSIQQSVILDIINAIPFWHLSRLILGRTGVYRTGLSVAAKQRQTWRCKDGYVAFAVVGGAYGAITNKTLVEWMDSEEMADDFLKQMDPAFDMATTTQEFHDHLDKSIGYFFAAHTKEELYEGAIKRRIMLYPVSTVQDLLNDPQLEAREYWVEIDHPELGEAFIYPGPFVQTSETPLQSRSRAPLIGEHNLDVYQELGLSCKQLASLKQAKVI